MRFYTVHAPEAYAADLRGTDKFVFVRDGFHFWAMVFGPLWLLWKRLWLATLGWILLVAVFDGTLAGLGAGHATVLLAGLMIAILMGLEAATLQRWTLSRRNWRQLDVVVADDEEAAERRFFDRWVNGQRSPAYDPLTVERGGPPPTRTIPGQPFSKPPPPLPHDSIIGLFPEQGGSR